jgi:hypothetical protein
VTFTVNFSERVGNSFRSTAVGVAGTLSGAVTVAGTDPNYTVTMTLSDANANGTVGITIPGGVVKDLAGNFYAGGSSALCDIHNWTGFPTPLPQTVRLYDGDEYTLDAQVDEGGVPTSYQWRRDDGQKTVMNGPASPQWTLTGVTAADSGDYWCEVNFDGVTHASDTVALQVRPPVGITLPPAGGNAAPGGEYRFTVTAAGGYGPLSYQWKKDGENIPNAQDDEYVLPDLTAENAGRYSVEVSDTNGDAVESAQVTLSVAAAVSAVGLLGLTLLAATILLAGARRKEQRR